MISLQTRLTTVLVGAAGVLTLATSSAYAVWTTTGTGTGSAKATTFTAPTVSARTATGDLYPGLTANGTSTGGTLVVLASNPNPFPITVTVTGGTATGCTTTGVSIPAAVTFSLGAGEGPVTRSLPFSVSMSTASSDDCQGKSISIPLTTSAVSAGS